MDSKEIEFDKMIIVNDFAYPRQSEWFRTKFSSLPSDSTINVQAGGSDGPRTDMRDTEDVIRGVYEQRFSIAKASKFQPINCLDVA